MLNGLRKYLVVMKIVINFRFLGRDQETLTVHPEFLPVLFENVLSEGQMVFFNG